MADNVNSGVRSQRLLRDQVTPYKIVLLLVIDQHCKYLSNPDTELDRYSEAKERQLLIMLLDLVQGPDLELKSLMAKLSEVAKPMHVTSLVERMQELSEGGLSALMDLFHSVVNTLSEDKPVHRSSVLGLYGRRMVLAFDKLTFPQVTKLHARYQAYYEVWNRSVTRATDDMDTSLEGAESLSFPELAAGIPDEDQEKPSCLDHSMSGGGKYSQRQAEFFIAHQSFLLQHNELEALSPKPLQQKVIELLSNNPDLAEAHFLSYMNNLRLKEYCGAMESLFHYFDRQQATAQNSAGASKNKPDEDTQQKGFRYAALNLAALHYRFGHRAEALAAVQEAIRMAQEVNDHICLQHALGWLQRLGVQGTSNTAYMLDRLVTKSGELNLPYLASLGVQAFAKHNALSTAQPSSVFEFLMKSDIVNCQHSQSDLMCVSSSQKAALWRMYGKREMCSLSSQLMLHLNSADLGVYHNGEEECLALCHLVRLHAEQGDYERAFDILDMTKQRFPGSCQPARLWMLCGQSLVFTRALYHGKCSLAEQAVTNIAAIDKEEGTYCHCLLLKEKGELDKAFQSLDGLMEKRQGKTQGHPEFHARLLLLEGELFMCTENAPAAGPPLLACLTLSREHHLAHLTAMATVHLALVQFTLGMPSQACELIQSVLTDILSHGSLYDRARAYYLWARSHVALSENSDETERKSALLTAVQMMADVVQWFKQVEAHRRAKDAIHYLACLYHELGYKSERNKSALEFKQFEQQYPTLHRAAILSL